MMKKKTLRGGELKCYIHTEPLTKWVVEELSLLKRFGGLFKQIYPDFLGFFFLHRHTYIFA